MADLNYTEIRDTAELLDSITSVGFVYEVSSGGGSYAYIKPVGFDRIKGNHEVKKRLVDILNEAVKIGLKGYIKELEAKLVALVAVISKEAEDADNQSD